MKVPEIPSNEANRLKALKDFGILDTESEKKYEQIVQLAKLVCGTDIAVISLVDDHRQWFKERIGLAPQETAREISFCGHAILQNDIFEVENALLDPRFSDNPLVTDDPNIRFYAGAPLQTNEGYNIGTICVIDPAPQKLNKDQKSVLKILSKQLIALLYEREQEHVNSFASFVLKASQEGAAVYNEQLEVIYSNKKAYKLLKLTKDQFYGRSLYSKDWKVVDLHGKVLKPEEFPVSQCFQKKADIRNFILGVYDDNGSVGWITVDAIYKKNGIGKAPVVYGKWRGLENDINKLQNKELQVLGIENLQEGIVMHDKFDKITGYNSAALKMLQLSADQIEGKSSFDPMWKTFYPDGSIFPPEEHPSAVAIRTGQAVNDVTMGVATGKINTAWLRINAAPVFAKDSQQNSTDTILGAIVTIQDISDELNNSRKLNLMSQAVQYLTSPVVITNNTGIVEFVNPAFSKIFGYDSKEVVGERISVLKSGEHSAEFYKRMWSSLLEGGQFIAEIVNKSKKGSTILQNISINSVYSGDTVVNYVAVYSNLEENAMSIAYNKRMEEKDVLMKEIHHRVKNNLQVISSLLALQETKENSGDIHQVLQKAQLRINSIALLHEKLYQNNNVVSVDISTYLKELAYSIAEQLKSENKEVQLHFEVEQYEVPFDRLIPFGLIFNEIITNSFKYGFPNKNGIISVRGFVNDGQVKLTIYDNGVGAPSKAHLDRKGSLGSKLINLLVKQLKGTMTVNTAPNEGVSYSISFNVK